MTLPKNCQHKTFGLHNIHRCACIHTYTYNFLYFQKWSVGNKFCFIWKTLNFASVFETGFHVPRLALTPNPPSCLQRSSAGITGAHHYCLTFEIYIYYIKNSRSILFSLKFLQFISYLYDRAKVPPSSCLIWSHLWFSLKLILPPPPHFSTPTTKSPVGKFLTLL